MLLAIEATVKGLARALFSVRSVFFLYLPNLVLSACVAVPIYETFKTQLASSPATRELFDHYDGAFVADFMRVHSATFGSLAATLAVASIAWFLIWIFVEGGALAALAEPTRKLTLTGFFAACGRNFFAFLRGLVPAAIATWILAELNSQASSLLTWYFDEVRGGSASASLLGYALAGKTVLFLALFLLLVLMPTSIARVRAVVDDDRSMLRGYFQGLHLCLRRPFTMLLFSTFHGACILAVFFGVDEFMRRIPLDRDWAPLSGILGEGGSAFDFHLSPIGLHITIFQLALWLLMALVVARCAGLVAIYRATTTPRAERDPELVYARSPVVDAPQPRGPRGRSQSYAVVDDESTV